MKLLERTYPFFIILFFSMCSSSELIENWKNPEVETFRANKVLVVAMTGDQTNRKAFESKLVQKLKTANVIAVSSLDFFDNTYSSTPITEAELRQLEEDLQEHGFDAVLISKLTGAEDRVSLVQAYKNFDKTFKGFREDYYETQDYYNNQHTSEHYTVYHAESALYCICPVKDSQLIWKGSIDVVEPDNPKKAIKDYINVLLWALEEQNILIFNHNA